MDIINKKNLVFYDKDWNSSNLTNERNLLLTIYGKVSCGKLKFIDDNVEGFVEIPSSFLNTLIPSAKLRIIPRILLLINKIMTKITIKIISVQPNLISIPFVYFAT